MTDLDRLNRIIAEYMGWHLSTHPKLSYGCWVEDDGEVYTGFTTETFTPTTNLSQACEAADRVFKADRITRRSDGKIQFVGWLESFQKVTSDWEDTRSLAVCRAIEKAISQPRK